MTAIILALLSAAGFAGAGLFGLAGSRLPARGRAYATAVAAGILLVVAFGDLYPDSLVAAGSGGIVAFIGGFALLFLVEALTHAHTHHTPDESVHEHAIGPFALGLGLHNLADGFALGVAALLPGGAVGLVGLGVLIHQVPVGLSLAAVMAAAHVPRRTVIGLTLLLGLAIPLAAAATAALPAPGEWASGVAVGAAGGVLAYLATAHLLPEAQSESPGGFTALLFLATLALMTLLRLTVLAA